MISMRLSANFSRVMAILLADEADDDEEEEDPLCLAYDFLLALNFLEGEPPPEEGS